MSSSSSSVGSLNSKKLRCIYTNLNSLNNKFDLLKLELYNGNVDLCCISETWWKSSSIKVIEGYRLYFKDREGHGGGVCVYVKETIESHEVNDEQLSNSKKSEQVWCVIKIGIEKILVGCCYRPPGQSQVQESDLELINSISYASSANYDGYSLAPLFAPKKWGAKK
jgi:exonuclease III